MRTIEEFNRLWTDEVLEKLSLEMDPLADGAAQQLLDRIGSDPEKKKQYIQNLAKSDHFEAKKPGELTALIPPKMSAYYGDQGFALTDAEKTNLDKASTFFEKNGPAIIMILATRSLLKQYSSINTSELLGRTKLLESHAHRRIIETMQFVMDVMTPKWFVEQKTHATGLIEGATPAVHTLQKLRLIHAMIRVRVLKGQMGDWNVNELDAPINQEDMIMANYTFSLEIIEGLKQLGKAVSDEERDDFFKAWQIIGRLLGIKYPDNLMPETYEEAWALQNKLYEKNFKGKNEHGAHLAEALINWMVNIIPMTNRHTILDLIEEINGPENKKLLEEKLDIKFETDHPENARGGIVGWAIQKLKGSSTTANRTFFEELFNHMINTLLGAERGGKERRFRINDGFEKSWKLIPENEYKPVSNIKLIYKMSLAILKTFWHRISK